MNLSTRAAINKVNRQLIKNIRKLPKQQLALLLAVGGFATVGVYLLLSGSAATAVLSLQPESGTATSPATRVNDTAASGGAAVKFGAAITPPTPNPPSPPVTGGPWRAFTPNSYWNTPFPANAPIDPESARYIADSMQYSQSKYLVFTMSDGFGQNIYYGSPSDPVYNLQAQKGTVPIHIPLSARPATGSDSQMVVFDRTPGFNRVVGMWRASFNGSTWSTQGQDDNWQLDSNGLDAKFGGHPLNGGHRGVNAAVRAVRYDELKAGVIEHRTECFWHHTGEAHVFPMTGHESGKGGIVPEGIAIRIKPSVNLATKGLTPGGMTVATMLQKYGCVVGDNNGKTNRLKIQVNGGSLNGLIGQDDLRSIPWTDYEFVKAGYDPTTNTVR